MTFKIIRIGVHIFKYFIENIDLTSKIVFVEGVIESSLYKSMKDKGLSEIVIEEMIRIFSFDVDFQRDIYKGDKYEILFTKKINYINIIFYIAYF